MKKLFILILLLIPITSKAENNIAYNFRNNHYLCKDNQLYQTINTYYNGKNMYAIKEFNVFYGGMYTKYNGTLDEGIQNMLAYEFIASKYASGSRLFSIMGKLLADYLGENTYLCNSNSEKIIEDEALYEKIKAEIMIIDRGPFSNSSYEIASGEVLTLNSDYLNYYEITSSDSLTIEMSSKQIKISGEDGTYDLSLKKKSNNAGSGETYFYADQLVASTRDFPNKEYHYQITIGQQKVNEIIKEDLPVSNSILETNTYGNEIVDTYQNNNVENPQTSDKIAVDCSIFMFLTLFLLKMLKIKRKLKI